MFFGASVYILYIYIVPPSIFFLILFIGLIIPQGIRTCKDDGCDDETINKVLRGTITLMGRRRSEGEHHEHLYFKFQNSK